jgi:signal transduction histidine kinase
MSKQKKAFSPKARLIQILGEYLIKDATVGILELIKNSYDADATLVNIEMHSLNKENAKIIIKDNGLGMDEDTFVNKWMNPATGHKEKQKKDIIRTALGRLPLGEKGVGRFATQQIGNQLKMISKVKKSSNELVVDIDWFQFENNDKDLEDIEVEYEFQNLSHFKDNDSGTILEITKLKAEWKENDIARISETLRRMKKPFRLPFKKEKGDTNINNFEVSISFIDCPIEFEKYENLENSDILDKAHYRLLGILDAKGKVEFEYLTNIPGEEKIENEGTFDIKEIGDINIEFPTQCGAFFFNFYHYNKNLDKKSGFNKKDVEALAGVNIYRDGIRVMPYGELGNDWLSLDNERIQNTSFIGNDTIIGLIEINQVENSQLKDKTNREGLIENEAYNQFRKLALSLVKLLHKEKISTKPKKQKTIKNNPNIDVKITDAVTNIKKVLSTLSNNDTEDVVKSVAVLKKIESDFEVIKVEVDNTIQDFTNTNERLTNLAGTGLAAERFTHEFARLVVGANMSLEKLKKLIDLTNELIKKEVDIIGGSLEALRNDIRLLGPMFYVKKVAREKELDLRQVVNNTIALQEHFLKKENINVELIGASFKITMREGSCMQIFNNLIDNSIYWLSQKKNIGERKIRILFDDLEQAVYVSDSGNGVVERYRDRIFEPFFSMKGEEGRGLGLYIIKEILEEKNWDIFLINQEDYSNLLKGASFKIMFTDNKL